MIIYPLFSLITVLGANINTSYHPHLKFKKYIKIKNPKLATILINKWDPLYIGKRRGGQENRKANQNKLLLSGLIFYILSLITLISSIILIYVIPEIPMSLTNYETNIDALYLYDTLNKKLTLTIPVALISIEVIFCMINGFKYRTEKSYCKKTTKIITSLYIFIILCIFIYSIWTIFSDIFAYLV